MTNSLTYFVATTYQTGSYGSSNYNGTNMSAVSSTGSPGSAGVLTNTGFDLVLVATIAITLILVAVIIRFWRRPKIVLPIDKSKT